MITKPPALPGDFYCEPELGEGEANPNIMSMHALFLGKSQKFLTSIKTAAVV